MDSKEILFDLYKEYCGTLPMESSRLPGGGGDRTYYRLSAPGFPSIIGVAGDTSRDCRAFTSLSDAFVSLGIPVPAVYGRSADGLHYIQEDLGDVSLFDMISDCRRKGDSDCQPALVEESLRGLARLQTLPADSWEGLVAYSPFSRRQAMWDLNYFKYEFLRPMDVDFDEDSLEDDFERFADSLAERNPSTWGFMYRDFQSRNVMIKDGMPRFIDFQGGRPGPSIYDAISFLWQAKAGFSDAFRNRMLEAYADEYCSQRPGVTREELLGRVDDFAFFRTLQVLGAYGFRGLVQHRAHFIESIPMAVGNLDKLLKRGVANEFPALERACRAIFADSRFRANAQDDCLTVHIFSFSYKKGYPDDYSGNGGGFMFDCRGMHNPGRYDEYKRLTGLDAPVIEFLESRGEVQDFCRKAVEMVSPTIECYIRRGFTGLQVGFGCTGGRHRSVYCAQHVAEALAMKYPEAKFRICHREQGVEKEL